MLDPKDIIQVSHQLPFLMSAIKPHEINHNCRLGVL